MSFFTDWRSHYTVGYVIGLSLFTLGSAERSKVIDRLDRWAWAREWKQNRASNTPNPVMSKKQQKEAAAWGAGARAATGSDDPYPSPPYEEGYTWT